jgi:hypothetical protein
MRLEIARDLLLKLRDRRRARWNVRLMKRLKELVARDASDLRGAALGHLASTVPVNRSAEAQRAHECLWGRTRCCQPIAWDVDSDIGHESLPGERTFPRPHILPDFCVPFKSGASDLQNRPTKEGRSARFGRSSPDSVAPRAQPLPSQPFAKVGQGGWD